MNSQPTTTRPRITPHTRPIRLLLLVGTRQRLLPITLLTNLAISLREVLPFAPAVEIDQCLHTAPLHDFSLKPDEIYRLQDV